MVAALKMHGAKLAVLSNKPDAFTRLFVDEFFPGGQFSIVHGQRHDVPKKPDPTVALAIAAQLNAHPQETFFVGDSGVDIKTGKAAEMITVGVSWGFRSVRELTENNADMLVHNPLELQQYVLSFT
jgi:phosphoglycolate phosphatase